MRRIISLFIAIMTLFASSAMAVYIPQDVSKTEFYDDVELLIDLGLLEYPENGMMKPYSHMKRAEFAQFLDGILNDKSITGKDVFYDVDKDNFAWENINRLYEYGYISGDENLFFRPDDDITFNEAVKVMLSILGYDSLAKYKGGFPSGYLSIASDIGLTKGIERDGEYINRGNIIRLLINAFDKNPAGVSFDNGKPYITVNEDTTMLAEACGIYKVKDYVNANSDYAMSGDKAKEGYLYIGSREMLCDGYEDYVGFYVECYYKETEPEEYEVVYIRKIEGKSESTAVEAKDIFDVENHVLHFYTDNDKTDKVKLKAMIQ